jgi:hypothetical protein
MESRRFARTERIGAVSIFNAAKPVELPFDIVDLFFFGQDEIECRVPRAASASAAGR